MQKFDSSKPRVDLVPPILIEEVAKVLDFGAQKYAVHQWREGTDWTRMYAACQRHLLKWVDGETIDPDSGLNHLTHAACNIAFLLEYENRGLGKDTRFKYPSKEDNHAVTKQKI